MGTRHAVSPEDLNLAETEGSDLSSIPQSQPEDQMLPICRSARREKTAEGEWGMTAG